MPNKWDTIVQEFVILNKVSLLVVGLSFLFGDVSKKAIDWESLGN